MFLKENITKEDPKMLRGLIEQIMMAKDFFIALCIILFVENPYLQLIPTIIIYAIAIVLLIRYKPYNSKLVMATVTFNEIVYALVLFSYLIFNMVKGSMSFESKRKLFGYTMIFIVSISIVFNLGVAWYGLYTSIRDYCKKKKEDKELKQNNE